MERVASQTERPGVGITLLGGLGVRGPDGPLRLESAKTGALLAYLALTPGPHARAKLQGLLWPELPEDRAARNLRHALWDIRRKLGACRADVLAADRARVAFVPDGKVLVDALELVAARDTLRDTGGRDLPPLRWPIDDLLRGELLEGVFLADAPEFEEWLLGERERLRAVACDVLRALVSLHRQGGDLDAALERARTLVALDPWREESHRMVMELLTLAGEPAAALAQLEECRRILAEQLQTTPTADTVRLAERIRALAGGVATGVDPPLVRHNLPAQTTPFVGREEELEAVERLLASAECRLVCLLGPGGIGKTRLAIQIGQRQVLAASPGRAFTDGIWIVPPRECGGAGGVAGAVARALSLGDSPALGAPALEERLTEYLRHRRALLILDGFEHVLGEAGSLAALLAAAPLVKVLVTSRERLHLPGEWVVEVTGLAAPPGATADPDGSPAVQLFVQSARRARFGFDPTAQDLADVAALCSAVEGSPLAIELAAGWAGSLSMREIAAEVERHPAFLGSHDGGMRAVFASSWSRLRAPEREALTALSVFVGGYTREAAESVASASLATLRRLVDTSFLRHEASGRYTIHEVLRRFALDELARDPARLEQARSAHAGVIAARMRSLEARTAGACQRETLDEIEVELDNLQAAWRWAVTASRHDVLVACLGRLQAYAESRGWLRAAETLVGEAVNGLGGGERELLAELLIARGSLRNRMGAYAPAETDLERALGLTGIDESRATALAHLGAAAYLQGRHGEARQGLERAAGSGKGLRLRAMCSSLLGRVALEEGRHDDAEAAFNASLVLAREAGDSPNVRWAVNQLGLMAYFRGDLDQAHRLFEDAFALARAAGDMALVKEAATGLGYVSEDRGDFEGARERYQEALAVSRESGDRRGEVHSLMVIGETFRRPGAFAEARACCHDALGIAREIGSTYHVGLLIGNLAYLEAAAGQLDEAAAHVREVVRAYREGGPVSVVLPAVVSAAEILHRRGATRRAVELLGLVLAHPSNRKDHTEEAQRVLALVATALPPRTVTRHLSAGAGLDLEVTVRALGDDGGLDGSCPREPANGAHAQVRRPIQPPRAR